MTRWEDTTAPLGAAEPGSPSTDPLLRELVAGLGPGEGGADAVRALAGAGRFEIGPLLGRGGFGAVYRARDTTLDRAVALKLLRVPDAAMVARLLKEARAQAQIEHDNVCRVYDVGELAGAPFIAMQLVDGRTLSALRPELRLEEIARIVRDVAAGVQAAHTVGLIHRDLKPDNIMVERTPAGWKPYVLDFGLARDVEAASQTVTGNIVGTPYYMSPEQVRGRSEQVDRRSDVYSLGATLYHLLAGVPPFAGGSSAEILMQILGQEPIPLRRAVPDVPRDLEAVVMRCLEKRPGDRYESARALADDLGRFLDGVPVAARRSSVVGRLVKLVRRRRQAAAGIAAAVLAVLVTATLGLRATLRAHAEARAAEDFAGRVAQIESTMRLAYLEPLHDVRPEQATVRAEMMRIASDAAEIGSAADRVRHAALGRAHLALGAPALARAELEAAWAAGVRSPDVGLALAQALGALYRKALRDANQIHDPALRAAARARVEHDLRDPALDRLRALTGAGDASAYVAALAAHYEGRPEDAARLAAAAIASAPMRYEARALESEILLAQGSEAQDRGDYGAALERYRRADASLAAALDIGRSDPALHERGCEVRAAILDVKIRSGQGTRADLDAALEPCARALRADPGRADVYQLQASLLSRWADEETTVGTDPTTDLATAAAAAERAVALAPDEPGGLRERGKACLFQAEHQTERGADASAGYACAVASLTRAVELDPGFAPAVNMLGRAYLSLGDDERGNGRDPRAAYDQAVLRFEAALDRQPNNTGAADNMGLAFKNRGAWEDGHALDPTASYERAVAAYQRAIAIDARNGFAYANLGVAQRRLAERAFRVGLDPEARLGLAVAASQRAVMLKKTLVGAWSNLEQCWLLRARAQMRRGGDPAPALDEARAAGDQAVALNAASPALLHDRAEVELVAAEWTLRQRRSPAPELDRAGSILRRALALDANMPELHAAEAERALLAARWRLGAGEPGAAATEVAAGLAEAERWRAANPTSGQALALRGSLELAQAQTSSDPAARAAGARTAAASLRHAIELDPLLGAEVRADLAKAEALGR
jgi:serine/threonine-protein kinase